MQCKTAPSYFYSRYARILFAHYHALLNFQISFVSHLPHLIYFYPTFPYPILPPPLSLPPITTKLIPFFVLNVFPVLPCFHQRESCWRQKENNPILICAIAFKLLLQQLTICVTDGWLMNVVITNKAQNINYFLGVLCSLVFVKLHLNKNYIGPKLV